MAPALTVAAPVRSDPTVSLPGPDLLNELEPKTAEHVRLAPALTLIDTLASADEKAIGAEMVWFPDATEIDGIATGVGPLLVCAIVSEFGPSML